MEIPEPQPRIYPRLRDAECVLSELVEPEYPESPMGADDALTDYLYGEVIATNSSVPLEQLIDAAAERIFPDFPNDQTSQLAVQRTLRILVDIPEQANDEVKVAAWRYFLGKDWAIAYEYPAGAIDEALYDMQKTQPDLVASIRQEIRELAVTKQFAVGLATNFELPLIDVDAVDTAAVLDKFSETASQVSRDNRSKYLAAITLAHIYKNLQPEAEG